MYRLTAAVFVSAFLFSAKIQAVEIVDPKPAVTPPAKIVDTAEILSLNERMRALVDLFVKPIESRERRAQELYKLMFDSDKFALIYDNSYTKTAIETVESGSGNCVSLANAFVAMGRYAGLKVNYLDVNVPDNWQRDSDLYYQLKHISASVKVSANEYLGIEYRWMGEIGAVRPRTISDEQAFGSFYSNRGIELLMHNNPDAAMLHLKRAIEIDPDNADNWSNIGVAYRRINQLDAAEQAYLQALKLNHADLTALNNLSILYQMNDKKSLAEKYIKKLERYRRKNPYHLIKLAKDEITAGNYSKALKYTKKAIKKYDEEHEFHYVAARIYAHQGDIENAMESLELAEKHALSARNKNLYDKKLELLRGLDSAR